MATKGKGAQENSIFAGKEQGHHAPAELLVEPPRKCLSSPTQGTLVNGLSATQKFTNPYFP